MIIDGNLYSQKIVDLEMELDKLRNNTNEEIERRVQEIMVNLKNNQTQPQHDC